ncbi:MAG: HAMP domain-containing histidine kinase [Hymenobacter sp.]|nr:MAG: HAMP domain-containing histidine kinase [Hymenobacter sp.]
MPTDAAFFVDQARAHPHIQFIYDLATRRVTFINAAYEHVLGGDCARVNEELPALLARIHPDDLPMWHYYWLIWTKGELRDEVEFRVLVPEQEVQWFCLTPHWRQDAKGGDWLGGTLHDVSLSKRLLANSEKFNTKKNTLLEILSHDMAGYLAMFQQMAAFVQEEMTPQSNPRVPEMLRLIRTNCQKGHDLIHSLVNQELLESTQVDLRLERVDLGERLEQALDLYRRAPGREAWQFTYKLPAAPIYVAVDINKLMQVISNLVHNAFKFTPEKGRITVTIKALPASVSISVIDEGIGIPAQLQSFLFERYTKARRRGLRGEATTGLGLWLCRTIVELHQGKLTVVTAEGKGSTFTVTLPRTFA